MSVIKTRHHNASEITFDNKDFYKTTQVANMLNEYTRLYNSIIKFLKNYEKGYLSHPLENLSHDMILVLVDEYKYFIADCNNYNLIRILNRKRRDNKPYLAREIYEELLEIYPLNLEEIYSNQALELKIVYLNYNSPFKMAVAGSFVALAMSVALFGGEIEVRPNGTFSAKVNGVSDTTEQAIVTLLTSTKNEVDYDYLLLPKELEDFNEEDFLIHLSELKKLASDRGRGR